MGWLASHDRWLLVLDNVEERADVEPLLGELTNGHILITTRRDVGWQDITDGCIHLDVLDPTTAVALLLGLSEQDDPATAGVLAGELGCLPLALQQAGAYLRQTRTSMAEYLHRLRNQPAEMLASVAVGNDAQRAVARAWSVTIDRITEQTPLALRVLQILSCVAPEALPRDVLTPIAEPGELDAALGALSSYHMITLAHHAVATHRLVQAVTIGQLRRPSADEPDTPKAFAVALRQTVEVLWSAVPSGDPNNAVAEWPQWAALSPHVTALARLCPDDVGGTDLADLLHETAWYFYVQRRLDEAESLHRRVLAVREAAYGPDHPDVAASLHGLAIAVRELGRPAEAEPLHRRALTTFEAAYGPDHPNVATTLNNLANSLRNLSRPADCTVEPWPSVKPPTVRTIPTWQPA